MSGGRAHNAVCSIFTANGLLPGTPLGRHVLGPTSNHLLYDNYSPHDALCVDWVVL